jgi:DNA-directed RNA polymerase subunit RPC12/RpoP/predicted small lipoprotein YifL
MTLVICSSCQRHIRHPEVDGASACSFCGTPLLVEHHSDASTSRSRGVFGVTVVAALMTAAALPACGGDAPLYGAPSIEEEDTTDAGSDVSDAEGSGVPDGSTDGSGEGSGDTP